MDRAVAKDCLPSKSVDDYIRFCQETTEPRKSDYTVVCYSNLTTAANGPAVGMLVPR